MHTLCLIKGLSDGLLCKFVNFTLETIDIEIELCVVINSYAN